MPHMCTRCRKVFQDGIDLLQGCPACGWKKFQFMKTSRRSGLGNRQRRAAEEVVEKPVISSAMGVRRPPRVEAASELEADRVVVGDPEKADKEGAMELESIRIEEPGSYELNLDTLFNRGELVMALKEGTYVIDLSTAFRRTRKD